MVYKITLLNSTPHVNLATAVNLTEQPENDGEHLINVTITRPTSQQQLVNSTELIPSTEISKAKSESLTVEVMMFLLTFD